MIYTTYKNGDLGMVYGIVLPTLLTMQLYMIIMFDTTNPIHSHNHPISHYD
jgi:hypothetical protein